MEYNEYINNNMATVAVCVLAIVIATTSTSPIFGQSIGKSERLAESEPAIQNPRLQFFEGRIRFERNSKRVDLPGNRVPSHFAAGLKTIKGDGTAGMIPLWIDSGTIGDSIVSQLNGNIGIGTASPGSKLTVAGRIEGFTIGISAAVLGQSTAGSGVRGNSDSGFGVFGSSTTSIGVQGLSTNADGVFGFGQAGNGVAGDTIAAGSYGVKGTNSAAGGVAVLGRAVIGTGVRGESATGNAILGASSGAGLAGLLGTNANFAGFGVQGRNLVTNDFGYIGGQNGVYGFSTNGGGVVGESVNGLAGSFIGNVGVTGNLRVGINNSGSKIAVTGLIESVTGGFKFPDGTIQMTAATSGLTSVAHDTSLVGAGTGAQPLALSVPLFIAASSQSPLVTVSNSGTGGTAVIGHSDTGNGIQGVSPNGFAVLGSSSNGTAGAFFGDVFVSDGGTGNGGNLFVTGMLSKGGGSFKIDHPLEPENKYLSHSFVESPDMMNLYNGNVTLDGSGEAVVALPAYFEALNAEFRYQLTCVGGFAPVYIAEKIANNRFRIAGGFAGLEVSWQVTGVRRDAWANRHRIAVEEEKPEAERGFFLHPDVYKQSEDKGVESARHGERMRRVKEYLQRSQRR